MSEAFPDPPPVVDRQFSLIEGEHQAPNYAVPIDGPSRDLRLGYSQLPEDLLAAHLKKMQSTVLLSKDLVEGPLEILDEPEIYPEDVEDEVLAVNQAISKATELVRLNRTEATTHLLRVLRNTVATLVLKDRYDPEDAMWQVIAERIDKE